MGLRWLMLACAQLLAGCVAPGQFEKARSDVSIYAEQKRERESMERCMDGGAMPGTPAYLECRLKLENPAPQKQPAH